MKTDILKWLEEWYAGNCDGEWEHGYGVRIDTLDNPGWSLRVDLRDTPFENEKVEYTLTEKDEEDWFGFKVESAEFNAVGDPTKLSLLLELFRSFVEERTNK